MTRLTTNMHQILFAALTMLLMAAAAVAGESPVAGHVTVQAERPTITTVGRSAIGAPIVVAELSHRVSYSDLELSIPSNAKVLKQRVHDAARGVCADLERLYPVSVGGDNCARDAEEGAMTQVDAAIAATQARKSER